MQVEEGVLVRTASAAGQMSDRGPVEPSEGDVEMVADDDNGSDDNDNAPRR